MLTQPPITLVPPKSAVVTNEWSCTTISTTCLREWEEKTSIILNILFLFLLYTLCPIHLLSVPCHSCAIIPHCISPTAYILSLFPISHHFPPSSAYCFTLKREVTNFPKGWYTFTHLWGHIFPPKSLYIFTFLITWQALNTKDHDCQYNKECRAKLLSRSKWRHWSQSNTSSHQILYKHNIGS